MFLHTFYKFNIFCLLLQAAMETTIGNNNASLWQYVVPDQIILEWQRNIIANRLAKDGKQWVSIFSIMNSGTLVLVIFCCPNYLGGVHKLSQVIFKVFAPLIRFH